MMERRVTRLERLQTILIREASCVISNCVLPGVVGSLAGVQFSVSWSPDSKSIFTSSGDKTVKLCKKPQDG